MTAPSTTLTNSQTPVVTLVPCKDRLLPEMDRNLLHNLLSIQAASRDTAAMTKFITRQARKAGAVVSVDQGNIYVTKGSADVYPCVVAHTDTVHSIVPADEYSVFNIPDKDSGDALYFGWNSKKQELTGVGGDDKVGIYIGLMALRAYDNIKLAFFRDEEIGCVGSGLADMTFFDDVTLVLQGDRRGNDDFVSSIYADKLFDDTFKAAVSPILTDYGYSFTSGAMTDVHELKTKGLAVACANFSCGYWNPHTSAEYINLTDLQNTLGMVYTVFNTLGGQKWPHVHTKSRWTKTTTTGTSQWDGPDYDWKDYEGGGYSYSSRSNTYSKKADNSWKDAANMYRGVDDDGPEFDVENDFQTFLKLSDRGGCPICDMADMVEFDDDLKLYMCERCVTYILPV